MSDTLVNNLCLDFRIFSWTSGAHPGFRSLDMPGCVLQELMFWFRSVLSFLFYPVFSSCVWNSTSDWKWQYKENYITNRTCNITISRNCEKKYPPYIWCLSEQLLLCFLQFVNSGTMEVRDQFRIVKWAPARKLRSCGLASFYFWYAISWRCIIHQRTACILQLLVL